MEIEEELDIANIREGDYDKRNFSELCRVCANTNNSFIPIYGGEGLEHNILTKIEQHLPIIKINEFDKLPLQICYQCASTLITWNSLYENCKQADKKLKEMLTVMEKEKMSECGDGDDNASDGFHGQTESSIRINMQLDSGNISRPVGESSENESIEDVAQLSDSKSSDRNETNDTINESMLLDNSDSEEYDDFYKLSNTFNNERTERLTKKHLRDYQNPMDCYFDDQFLRIFRFSKRCVLDRLLPMVNRPRRFSFEKSSSIPPILQLLCTLRFYATGNYQTVCSDLHGISESSVYRIVEQISLQLTEYLPIYVKMPNRQVMEHNKSKFYDVYHFPGVIGLIDCTHVPITCPNATHTEEPFRNRKGSYSMNVQVICGPQQEILDIVTRWPGSTHDNRIFENSTVRRKFERNEIDGYLLGDKGYAQTSYLFTPVPNPTTAEEIRYNIAHEQTRKLIDGLFAVWKRRFPCLRKKLENKLRTTLFVITATAVLHNITIVEKEPPVPYSVHDHEEREEFDGDADECLRRQSLAELNLPLGMLNESSSKKFVCENCGNQYCKKYTLQKHILSAHMLDKDTQLFSRKIHDDQQSQHQRYSSKSECAVCGKLFTYKRNLRNHIKNRHTVPELGDYTCKICDKRYYSKYNLQRHSLTHENSARCDMCGNYYSRQYLQIHKQLHSKEKPYICDMCGKSYSQRGSLRAHRLIEMNAKKYICNVCGLRFALSSRLQTHLKTHLEELPFKCDKCDKRFVHKWKLKQHGVKHSLVRQYCCEFCARTFKTGKALKHHQLIHQS